MNRPKAKLSLTAEWNGLWSSTTHWWPHKVDQVVHYTCCIVECGHTKSYLVHMADHTKWTKWSTLLSPVRNTGDHTNTWSMLLTASRPMGLSDGKHFCCRPVTRDNLKLGSCNTATCSWGSNWRKKENVFVQFVKISCVDRMNTSAVQNE